MSDDLRFGDFTRGEKMRVVTLTARMATPGADIRKLQRQVEAIEQGALRRKNGQ